MADAPKRVKPPSQYAAAARREPASSAPVSEGFKKRWERGELGGGELSEIIHQFHQGPARAVGPLLTPHWRWP